MRKSFIIISAFLFFSSCDTLNQIAKDLPTNVNNVGLTSADVAKGLKNALSVGTDSAVGRLTRPGGYLNDAVTKILLPPEAKVIFDNLSKIPGGQDLVNKTITSINSAAEDAAKEAAPIFKNAITSMTINDAFGILNGAENSATTYLKDKTYSQLTNSFSPKINASLSKPLVFGQSTSKLYSDLIATYNKVSLNGNLFPMVKTNTLGEYVTTQALTGLFLKVANEESLIRKDPTHRVTDILQKVFKK